MLCKKGRSSYPGRSSDYARQARIDFATWELLERAGLLPPAGQLPTQQLIDEAARRLARETIPSCRPRRKRRR